jgi:hypothetical protein
MAHRVGLHNARVLCSTANMLGGCPSYQQLCIRGVGRQLSDDTLSKTISILASQSDTPKVTARACG